MQIDYSYGVQEEIDGKCGGSSECLARRSLLEREFRDTIEIHTVKIKDNVARIKQQATSTFPEALKDISRGSLCRTTDHMSDLSTVRCSSDYEAMSFSKDNCLGQINELYFTKQLKNESNFKNICDGQPSDSSDKLLQPIEGNKEKPVLPKSCKRSLQGGDKVSLEVCAEKTETQKVDCLQLNTEDKMLIQTDNIPMLSAFSPATADTTVSETQKSIDPLTRVPADRMLPFNVLESRDISRETETTAVKVTSEHITEEITFKNIFCAKASDFPIDNICLQDTACTHDFERAINNVVKTDSFKGNGSVQEVLPEHSGENICKINTDSKSNSIHEENYLEASTQSLSAAISNTMYLQNKASKSKKAQEESTVLGFKSSLDMPVVETVMKEEFDVPVVETVTKEECDTPIVETVTWEESDMPVVKTVMQEKGVGPAKENGSCLDLTSTSSASINSGNAVLDNILNEMACLVEELNSLLEPESAFNELNSHNKQATVREIHASVHAVLADEPQLENISVPSMEAVLLKSATSSSVEVPSVILATEYSTEDFSSMQHYTSDVYFDTEAKTSSFSCSSTSSIDHSISELHSVTDLQEQTFKIPVKDIEHLKEKIGEVSHDSVKMEKEYAASSQGIEVAYSLLESLILLSTSGEAGEVISTPTEGMQQAALHKDKKIRDKVKTPNMKEQLDKKMLDLSLEESHSSDIMEMEPEILEPYRELTPHSSMQSVVKKRSESALGISTWNTELQTEKSLQKHHPLNQQKFSTLDNSQLSRSEKANTKASKSMFGKLGVFTTYRKSRSLEKIPTNPSRTLEVKANSLASCESTDLPDLSFKQSLRSSLSNLSRILKGKSKTDTSGKQGSQSSLHNLLDDDTSSDTRGSTRRKSGLFSKLSLLKKEKAPEFTVELTDQVVTLGHSFTLTCKASGQPPPVFHWFKGDDKIVNGDKLSLSISDENCAQLLLRSACVEDTGCYKCVAVNSAGLASSSCMVTCDAGAQVTTDENTRSAPVPLRLACQVYIFLNEINRGRFSIVQRCRKSVGGKCLASKITPYTHETKRYVLKEYDILKQLQHVNIVKLHCAFLSPSHLVLVLELCVGLELLPYIAAWLSYSEQQVREFLLQVLSAVEYIHANGILHLDLRSENLMVIKGCTVKIIDFGSAHTYTSDAPVQIPKGSTDFIETTAPEVLEGKGVGPQTDIWAIGVLSFIMLSADYPFSRSTPYKTQKNIRKGKIKFRRCYGGLSEGAVNFIKSTLCANPWGRPCATECLQSLWLQGAACVQQNSSALFPTTKLKTFLKDRENKRAMLSTKHSVAFVQ
ncbi:uncharacterized protein LOC122797094 [Protopterus annectens]|uniref:uncharacterized protein LOC122797094 n=1 Tax=Protopterus annectens TaxID=7888 RepID=UPI001CFBD053|nr:uncharacterized protein LOC122797094 [Protopterus annectens]